MKNERSTCLKILRYEISSIQRMADQLRERIDAQSVPIPAPHGIGTWIHGVFGGGIVTMQISERTWNNDMSEWAYYGSDYINFLWHKESIVIPAPKFEVGETVCEKGEKQFEIKKREWSPIARKWKYSDKYQYYDSAEDHLTRVPDPPDNRWKVGEMGIHTDSRNRQWLFTVDKIDATCIYPKEGFTDRILKSACIPVHFIQTAESEIGEQCRVITPEGWVGIVTYVERNGTTFSPRNIRVINAFKENYGWYSASELTLCPPEGIE